MFSKRKILAKSAYPLQKQALIKKSSQNKTELEIEKIYALFKNDEFLKETVTIVRDFIITTWKMKNQNNIHTLQDEIIKLINKKIVIHLKENHHHETISSVTKSILQPFMNTNKNNKLYETIFIKWWSIYMNFDSDSVNPLTRVELLWLYGVKNIFIRMYIADLSTVTRRNIETLSKSTSNQDHLLTQNMDEKLIALEDLTQGEILKEMKYYHNVWFWFWWRLLVTVTFVLASVNVFIGVTKEMAILDLVFVMGFLGASYFVINSSEKYGHKGLADYIIADHLLAHVDTLLDEKLQLKNSPIIIQNKRTIKMDSTQSEPEENLIIAGDILEEKSCEYQQGNEIRKIRNDLREKNRENKRQIILQIKDDAKLQNIVWKKQDDSKKEMIYIYKPLKIKSVVFAMWSPYEYMKPFCKNNFLLCEKPTLRKLVPNKEVRSELKRIIRNGAVVKAVGQPGLVREDDSVKVKTLKLVMSHYRLHFIPSMTTTVMEGNNEVKKTLHTPLKLTND